MKRLLLATTACAVFASAPAFAEECRARLDGLEQNIGTEEAYWTVLRSGMDDEVGVLWDVASGLEREGNEEACLQIAGALEAIIAETQAPGFVDASAWEAEQLARLDEATPVTENQGRMRIQDILGMSVYTPRNEYLGEIDDVILSDSGIGYAVIERGGFLDIGDDEVPVPWDRFSVTRDRSILVLDIDPASLEEAPNYQVEMEAFEGENDDEPMVDFDAMRSKVDAFFDDLTSG